MEAMFLIQPVLPTVPSSVSVVKTIAASRHHDTHDTCSCGSDAAKQPQQASISTSQTSIANSSTATHLRTVSTATIVKPAYVTMDQETADELVEKTEQRVEHALLKATVAPFSVDAVPKFDIDKDLTRGDLLGSGGFANVYSVDVKQPSRLRFHKQGQQYVVKHLAPKLLADTTASKRKLHAGAKDIVLESHILSALNHPNIVKVHGLSQGGLRQYATTLRTDAYFMILPRLEGTLADKITAWKRERLELNKEKVAPSGKGPWWRRYRKRPASTAQQAQQEAVELQFLCERLVIVVDLCTALEYLHAKRIMHRDIKPPNIGFDKEGCLKLFDFGLAKELPPDSNAYVTPDNNSMYSRFTPKTFQNLGNTGTTRYMAPEVIRKEPYNCKVDVYATSIVLWELMTLKKPYGTDVSGQFVKECVALYDDRPSIPTVGRRNKLHQTVWPKALKKLVQQGWTKDIRARLSARQLKVGLEGILVKKRPPTPCPTAASDSPVEEKATTTSNRPSISASLTNTMSC